ncbi:uncharacterized protein Tco025E_07337 [Trypanosoma conorhini]|uniref:Uncharacterized protein n=1 Tax=Trypanosoma conorhini TaxID=83891 RepID=A0A3R7KJP8_9TRYP|nr:uncharacterized protein Tco025E_07337 [Trypanosoma conorhini]RNF07838.1 hypothetical protein Tco025E_07337 [Trypanosoma conorhini]
MPSGALENRARGGGAAAAPFRRPDHTHSAPAVAARAAFHRERASGLCRGGSAVRLGFVRFAQVQPAPPKLRPPTAASISSPGPLRTSSDPHRRRGADVTSCHRPGTRTARAPESSSSPRAPSPQREARQRGRRGHRAEPSAHNGWGEARKEREMNSKG